MTDGDLVGEGQTEENHSGKGETRIGGGWMYVIGMALNALGRHRMLRRLQTPQIQKVMAFMH